MDYREVLSVDEIKDLKQKGFSEEDIQNAVNETEANSNPLQQSYNQAMNVINRTPQNASNSLIAGEINENLIQWQLELDSILERIEHMLRGDTPQSSNGSIIWITPSKYSERIFNNKGVAEIMRILSNYVNRNTILSNYREQTIAEKMYDLGFEITDLIYLKYEQMFAIPSVEEVFQSLYNEKYVEFKKQYIELNFEQCFENIFGKKLIPTKDGWAVEVVGSNGTKSMQIVTQSLLTIASNYTNEYVDKLLRNNVLLREVYSEINTICLEQRKLYPIIVREIVDVCHSAYLRALHGGERESLREARSVSQTETTSGGVIVNTGGQQKERGLLNPLRYIKSKTY